MRPTVRVLFATSVLARGHGVSLVIRELALRLRRLLPNASIAVAALHSDSEYVACFRQAGIAVLGCRPEWAERTVHSWKPDVFLPHTDPFFAMAPAGASLVLHEHGDPSPALFGADRFAREQQRLAKQRDIYPRADVILAISEFQRHDLPWPNAQLLYNGCNHVPDLGIKPLQEFAHQSQPSFRLGVLSRLDGGESNYKGFELLQHLAPRLQAVIEGLKLEYCGKVSDAQAELLRAEGWVVHSGVSDAERNSWLRRCHVVVSPSLWEGFNLPLVEAQALGTLALAFDTGAHAEVTPFVCGGLPEMEGLLIALDRDRDLLARYSADSYQFVRQRFDWDKAAAALLQVLIKLPPRTAEQLRESRQRHAETPSAAESSC